MKKIPVFFALLSLVLVLVACGQEAKQQSANSNQPKASQQMTTKEEAITEAAKIYAVQKQEGTDFSRGPCLSNRLIPDWVLDIAHNPRTADDDKTENQCSAFVKGQAKHFVELDPEGNLIHAE